MLHVMLLYYHAGMGSVALKTQEKAYIVTDVIVFTNTRV